MTSKEKLGQWLGGMGLVVLGEVVGAVSAAPGKPDTPFSWVFYISLGIVFATAVCGGFYHAGKESEL